MDTSPQKKLQDFFSKNKILHYKKGETILSQSQIPFGVILVKKGYVRSFILSKEGKEITINLLKPYHIFPMQWALNGIRTLSSYQTLTQVDVFCAPKDEFLTFIRNNNDVLFFYMTKTLQRLYEASRRLEALIVGTARDKVVNILLFLADSLGEQESNTTIIPVPFTHQQLAAMVGLTRETTSLELEKLQEEDFLTQSNHIIILHRTNELKPTTSLT